MRIVVLERRRIGEAARALARAFDADEVYRSLWPDDRRRPVALRRFMTVPVADAYEHGTVTALEGDDGAILGVAAWLPPGAFPFDGRRKARAVPRMLGVAAAAPRSFGRLSRFGANIEAAFPDDRPAYLAVIGVVPEAQGGGLGGQLLAAGLELCDSLGADCYLETNTEGAARLYGRHGFEVLERGARLLPDGPVHIRMRRPAGEAPGAGAGQSNSGAG